MLAASWHGALRPRPAADEDSPLEERVRSEEAVDLLQGHAIVGADEWIAAQAGAGDEIDPAVVIDIRGRDADADERWVLGKETGEQLAAQVTAFAWAEASGVGLGVAVEDLDVGTAARPGPGDDVGECPPAR